MVEGGARRFRNCVAAFLNLEKEVAQNENREAKETKETHHASSSSTSTIFYKIRSAMKVKETIKKN